MSNILANNINPRSGNKITIGNVNTTVAIAGTATYEDVTSIDSVGVITARSGVNVTGGSVGIGLTNPFGKLQVRPGTDANFSFSTGGGESSLEIINDAGSANVPLNIRASEYKFKIQGTERLRIDASGNVLIKHDTQAYLNLTKNNGGGNGSLTYNGSIFAITSNSVAADMQLGTNSTPRLTIKVGGDICIGGHSTNYADSLLEVRDTNAGGDVAIRVTNNTTTDGSKAGIIFTNSTGDYTSAGIAHLRNDNALIFYNGQSAGGGGFDNATERLRIDSSGRLLLGTTTEGNSSADNLTIADSTHCGITLRSGTSSRGAVYFSDATSGNDEFDGYLIYEHDNRAMRFATAATERLRIDSSGRLLLGTASAPVNTDAQYSKFVVRGNTLNTNAAYLSLGNGKSTSSTGIDDNLGIIVFNDNDSSNAGEYARIVGATDGFNDTGEHPGKLIFSTTNFSQSSPTEKVRIDNAGHVGIGTDMTSQNVMLGVFGDGTGTKKPATIYQNSLTGAGSGNGFYVGINHNDQTGYVWNYEADALSFATNNVQRARIDSNGYMTVAPSGMMIRSGFYDPGTGTDATTTTTSATFTTLNVNGTGQVGHNIGKFSDDGLTYNKVSSNSHLNISVSLPFYLANGATGFGIRALLSTDDGSNYSVVTGLGNGPADKWGAGGYGGNTSGILNYTWNTRMNSARASAILAKTGTIRFYFEVAVWSSSDTLTIGDYPSYDKKMSIIVQEIAE